MKKVNTYMLVGGMILIVVLGFLLFPKGSGFVVLENFEGKVEFHKSLSCGCCGLYESYLRSNGGLNVDIMVMDDVTDVKEEYGVPSELRTCHTIIIDGYFVEGHVPLEAIAKLIEEKPDIAGIALPGMPSGSPGMPGVKDSDWVIYSVNKDGTYQEFMVI